MLSTYDIHAIQLLLHSEYESDPRWSKDDKEDYSCDDSEADGPTGGACWNSSPSSEERGIASRDAEGNQ